MLWKFVFTLTPNPIYNETAKNKISCCKETTAYFIYVGYTIELSNKFIVDFEKIIQFLGKYSNIQTETILRGK